MAKKKNLEKLKKFPVVVKVCGNNKVNIKNLLKFLKEKKIKNILVEGGGITNWSFVKENLVDEAIITITPYIIGGNSSATLVDGNGFSIIAKSTRLRLKNVTRMKNEVVLHYEN
jgi:2,5-diamino-6-(ribosylamino)-4(3H)-pyrimidinone 5'-phosphate reductase